MRVRCASVAARIERSADRTCTAQVPHFAGLRTEAGCSISVALVLQSFVAANRADPIWDVYPKGARRASQQIFAGCGAAGRGILKDYFQGSCERRLSRQDAGVTKEK